MGYDSFVYDQNKSGQYLPLVFIKNNGHNYPANMSYGLHTYVGTIHPSNGEGINVLPSIVSASLVGIDKSDQWGKNWVLMSQDFFNRNNQELVYLNGYSTHSGNDWWYDLMPNVFFYQIHDLYPTFGDSEYQFISVADRWLEAVSNMGGSATPWSKAYMDYRAWNLLDMTPTTQGVHQPEAAGAIAWLLYHAYKETQADVYRQGAEWSMEYLSEWNSNPSYELQLPYGVYTAARMNAELQTDYDVEKMLNWVFDRGPLRGWGVIKGIWGGVDVSGIVGEANDQGNDYAFLLNGVQQLGALVPMVRYDKRFANAIGKWALHLASASRYFYPGYLPDAKQDASQWSNTYDPDGYIGYEALREKIDNETGPISTGDALKGGWAGTNLSLYSSSSIGILGAIIEPTDVSKILRLDLLATDYYRDEAYPTYLYYNPYSETKSVEILLPDSSVDIYEALSETIIATSVSQVHSINIPALSSVILVLAPQGATLTYDLNKAMIEGVTVDYMQTNTMAAFPPRIQALATEDTAVLILDTINLYLKVSDPEQSALSYQWIPEGGQLIGDSTLVQWIAPSNPGEHLVHVIVTDEDNLSDTASILLNATLEINIGPEIQELRASARYTSPGEFVEIICIASDANGDTLDYKWSADFGTITGDADVIQWQSPPEEGIYSISIIVEDEKQAKASASISILVKSFNHADTGQLIAHYPFSGNADDISGNQLHGQVFGAKLTSDYLNRSTEAYYFDGNNDHIRVGNEAILNFQDEISLSCIILRGEENPNEEFVVSHGSWQNRWKISVTPDQKLRWTINTNTGIADLDSEIQLEKFNYYHVFATFDGEMMMLYIDGDLQAFKPHDGTIKHTDHDLLIGQMLPDVQDYNYKGKIDEVMIRDQAVSPVFVEKAYQELYSGNIEAGPRLKLSLKLWPNPASDILSLSLESQSTIHLKSIELINLQGIPILRDGKIDPVSNLPISRTFDISGLYS
jgi:hypothetical protein